MTHNDLQLLFSRPERPSRSILSVYLNVDQSQHSNRNRGFERQLKDMTSSIRTTIHDAAEMERLATAAHHIEDFASAYEPGTRGLLMFFDSLDGFFWHQALGVPIHNQARWDHELFLQPLANVFDQFERYGVVLVDRSRLRLFTVFLREIEELHREGFGPNRHLRRAVKDVDWLVQTKQVEHLVLAGAADITSELRSLFPKRLSSRVIGSASLPIDVATHDVLAASLKIAEEYERSAEVQTVREVIRGAARNEKTVAGLGHTLEAVNSDRVWELIYSEGLASPGFECVKCAALFSMDRKSCSYCGGIVRSVSDVVERAVGHLPKKIDPDKVKAEFKNGMLSLKAPIAEESRARKVQVEAA